MIGGCDLFFPQKYLSTVEKHPSKFSQDHGINVLDLTGCFFEPIRTTSLVNAQGIQKFIPYFIEVGWKLLETTPQKFPSFFRCVLALSFK